MTIIYRSFFCFFLFPAFFFCDALFANQEKEKASDADDTLRLLTRRENEHPLLPVIRWAEKERHQIAAIKDYTARLTKRENIDGVIQEPQVIDIKVRHEPFSIYVKNRFPARLNGQEAIYVEGKHEGKVIAHGAGVERTFGTQRLAPDGMIAMRGNKYPMTEVGLLNLVDNLLEVGRKDAKYGECEVRYVAEKVKVGKHDCILIEVTHPVPRKNFRFHIARIFVDAERNLPIRYESHDWPAEAGERPRLIEEYTYENLQTDVGLNDEDFDYRNPKYGFQQR